ncbi:hypothetical protein [Methylorubrum thiocyanatum]|jgi:putative transcriptional regulator|uniref:Uncharacterized protein n=1 Tax=Methylorubrum thiocyanatum TaxID=47958 RepID=A0AA40VC15_9HYPH|nr:hypothetical protein [Methylorubrum thiocyanatum]MBA8914849.1 hypothetical protein [Methylorubrum thiocyanatum]
MMKKPDKSEHDWSRFDAMSDKARHTAALADPDAQPLTPEDMRRMPRTSRELIRRRALDHTGPTRSTDSA